MSTKVLERAKIAATASVVEDTEQRTIEFYAAAFSKLPDKHGDRIDPHAFDEWLQAFYKSGSPLPLSYAHAALLNGTRDPFDIVGYAPADPEHVWADEYGLRIKGFLETGGNEKAQQVFSLASRGLLKAASLVFDVPYTGEKAQPDGSVLITNVAAVREAGPCIEGANDDAYVISVKTATGLDRRVKWSGDAAMASCSSAAEYGKIAFRRTGDSDPDTAAAWALPHHPNPDGAPGNADPGGVAAALGALNGGRGGPPALRDPAAARAHLEAHQGSSATAKAADPTVTAPLEYVVTTRQVKHASAPSHLQQAHDSLVLAGARCAAPVEEIAATAPADPDQANDEDGVRRRKSEEPEVQELREWLAEHDAPPKS